MAGRSKPATKKPIPFQFVLEMLAPSRPVTRPMFGCTSIYVGEKIVMVLRERDEYVEDNGVWIATFKEHHAGLRKELPSMRSIGLFGDQETNWQNLPSSSSEFEEDVMKACELVLAGDQRIGRIPKPRKKKSPG